MKPVIKPSYDPEKPLCNTMVLWRLVLLFRPYWSWMAFGIFLSLVTIVANVSLMALSGWFITSMAIAGVTGAMMNYFTPAAGIRSFAIARTVSRYLERLVTHEATFRLLSELRHWFYLHLEPLAPAGLQKYHSGDLLSRIRADIDALENVYLRIVSPVIVALIASSLFIYFLSLYDYRLALVELVLLLIAGVFVPLVVNRLSILPAEKIVATSTALRSNVVDGVQGLGELLIYGAAEQQAQKVDLFSQQLLDEQKKMARYTGLSQAALSLCANVAMLSVVIICIPLVANADMPRPELVMIALFTLASFEAILALPLAFQSLPGTLAAARRIFAIVDAKPLVTEPKAASPQAERCDIEFDNVSFRYDDASAYVLKNLSFKLAAGTRLAIVGSSGTGKSSIVSLLLRFWAPSSGAIRFGSHELDCYKGDDIRKYFSVVTQHSCFFNSTIKNNLLLANRKATQAQLEEVCRVAQIHDFIETLPEAYDTWVGEAGLKLSGGQLKRLTIARALLKDAPVLILDEPGEGLDKQTEEALLAAVFDYKKDASILLITHRKTGLDAMDDVLVLE
ncbi:MAG: thiol reductant ABC exporter subunit CydC [Gammaproteobacteria bacterium]|nr:thiol reductant ABC exporter subunit CydC [Gammaproteobacteria bacterium]